MQQQLIPGVTVTKTISINMTAEQWELYAMTPPSAVRAMNKLVSDAINGASDKFQALREVEKILSAHSHYGAADTEPEYRAAKIVTRFFG